MVGGDPLGELELDEGGVPDCEGLHDDRGGDADIQYGGGDLVSTTAPQ